MLVLAPLLAGCLPPPPDPMQRAETAWIQDINAEPEPEVRTVLGVTFTVPAGAESWVEFGPTAELGWSTGRSTDSSPRHEIVGMAPLSEVHLQIKAEVDGAVHESGVFTAETGQVEAGAPALEATVTGYDPGRQALFLLSVFGPSSFVVLVDLSGQTVWAIPQGSGDYGGIAAIPSWDSTEILFATNRYQAWDDQQLHRASLAGEEREAEPMEDGHHFFEQHPDGSIAWIAKDKRETEEYGPVVGDRIVVRSPEGEEETIFSTWDHIPLYESPSWNTPFYLDGIDWTHGSGLAYDPRRDSYTFTAAGADTVMEVAADGEVLLLAGGRDSGTSDYTFDPPESSFAHPHGGHRAADGDLLVFSSVDSISRAVRYEVDEDARVLREVWTYGADQERMVYGLGEVQELPDGNYLISWGLAGILEVVSPAGEVLWQASLPMGSVVGQAHLLENPYEGRVWPE